QTFGNLGSVYADKGEWDRAIEFYEKSLETKERVGDIHGMAQTFGNLGGFYQAQGDTEQAAHYATRAYLIFARLGARPEAEQAAALLVSILGSVEAADRYLSQVVESATPPAAAQTEEEGVTLEQLLAYVAQACRGDSALGRQLFQLTQQMAGDATLPAEHRALGRVLTHILAGERTPDLSALPPELAQPVHEMLDSLAGPSQNEAAGQP
ncbi:MAG: tetratricopeptide repeat protein, partial [Anaerolineae bacterium]